MYVHLLLYKAFVTYNIYIVYPNSPPHHCHTTSQHDIKKRCSRKTNIIVNLTGKNFNNYLFVQNHPTAWLRPWPVLGLQGISRECRGSTLSRDTGIADLAIYTYISPPPPCVARPAHCLFYLNCIYFLVLTNNQSIN